MSIEDIITKKEKNNKLTYEDLKYIVSRFINNTIPDYQIKSLLMILNDLSDEEAIDLTCVMLDCGNKIDWDTNAGIITGNYSLGDTDNKTTLILASILEACGIKFVGLCNEGFDEASQDSTTINTNRVFTFIDEKIKIPLSIPLIAANIMTKVLVSGINHVVIDIRFGVNSLIKSEKEADKLANLIIKISKKYNCKAICFIINGDIILGNSFGYNLKIKEVINVLQGVESGNLATFSIELASHLLSSAKSISLIEAFDLINEKLNNGSAYLKTEEIIGSNFDDVKLSNHIFSIKSNKTGFVKQIDNLKLHELVCKISGDSYTDKTVGISISKKVGDYVMENEEIAKVYLNKVDLSINEVLSCFAIVEMVGKLPPLISKIIE